MTTSFYQLIKISQTKILALISAVFVLNLFLPCAFAQQGNLQLDEALRAQVIEGALKQLNDAYVFPEVAKKMEAAIRERLARKEYDAITSPGALASTLTAHLQEVSHDKHLRVTYSRESFRENRAPSKEEIERQKSFAAARNFGFQKVERLDGNIGYIDLRGFMEADWAAETLAGAMNLLANTDALIFDIRNNGGGQPEMVALICSYLFDKRTHLNDIYWRPTNKTTEYWTLDKFAGKRYGEQKAVYVLTSRRTFSAAEEFTYNLKNLKRATIIGETTGGGAHPVEFRRINEYFGIGVPCGRAINPITKTNWEGTGVKPDVEVAADQALKVAHLAAVKSVSAKLTNPELKQQLSGLIASLQREVDAPRSVPVTQANSAAPPATDEVKLPDTPAGKTLAAFLKAFNTGSLEALKKFHQENGGNPDNAQEDMGFFAANGGLKVASVVNSSPTEITVLAQKKKDGGWINFGIEVGANPPHPIGDIRARPASAPAGENTPQAKPSADEPKLPDTPVGKTFAAFLIAFNSGDLKTMQQFHQERGDGAELAEKDLEFYQQTGGLKLHSLASASNEELSALVQTRKDGRWLKLTLEVQPSPPHAIDTIRVQPAAAPGGALFATGQAANNSTPARKLTEAEKLKEIESFLDEQAMADKFSGVALVAKDGKPIFKKAYGLANKTTQAPNKSDTKFNLGSMNKMFTAVSIAQLAQAGKLAFDDKVGKYLPDYPNQEVRDKVTIHHLLTHTSGLGSYWNKKFDERRAQIKTVADYLALFADEPLRFAPGERFEYSNSGFIVLGAIIEKVSGQNYFDYVRQHIYQPAGMTNTDCFEMSENTPNMAMGYTSEGEPDVPALKSPEGSTVSRPGHGGPAGEGQPLNTRKENTHSRPNRGGPAGGGYSTPEDLLKFANALTANQLLSAKYTELVTTGKVPMGGNQYAYGFGDLRINGKRAFGHNGGAPGIASSLNIFPELGYTVIVMTNYDPPMMMPVVRKIEGLVAQ